MTDDKNAETNEERNARIKREHDELVNSLSLPGKRWDPISEYLEEEAATTKDKIHGHATRDTWTKETARNLDLSDAEYAGWKDPDAAEDRAFQDYVSIAQTHQDATTGLYQRMQLILSEAVSDIEEIHRRLDRAGY